MGFDEKYPENRAYSHTYAGKGRGRQGPRDAESGAAGGLPEGEMVFVKGGKLWYNTARQSPGRAGQAEEGFLL